MQPRLKKRSEFVKVAQQGGYCPSSTLIVQYLAIESTLDVPGDCAENDVHYQGIRVGFTASKRVGNSVRRNRAKRRLREAFECVLKQEGLGASLKNCHIVIIAKQAAVSEPYEILLRDLAYALRKCWKQHQKERQQDMKV